MMEEYGYVLDYLPAGKVEDIKREAIAYLIGERFFTLLEAVIKKGISLNTGNRVYIGKDLTKRDIVDRIKDRISWNELSTSAKNELKNVISSIIKKREKEFVDFFNQCGPITIRQHQLELLPGVGKKHLNEILDERTKKKFESFEDMTKRISHLQNPPEIIAERIVLELQGNERYYLFTRPPFYKEEKRRW